MFLSAFYYLGDAWWIQPGSLLLTVIAMILIMLQNNEHMQELTKKQIEEMNKGTISQIHNFREAINNQIIAVRKSTEKQIQAIQMASKDEITNIQVSTQKQIEAIQDSTQKQIQAFVEQCQGIVAQLEHVVGVLATMSEQNTQKLKIEEERRRQKEEEIRMLKIEQQRKLQEELSEKERLKPNIFVRLTTQSYFLFWTHYWIYLINTGGDSKDMRVESEFFASITGMGSKVSMWFGVIQREQQCSFDCGNIDNFRAYDLVKVRLSIRDSKERRYVGEVTFSKSDNEWHQIPLNEKPG